MKKILALALSLMLAAPVVMTANAQAPATMEKKSGAVMTPDESKYEFGSVKQGDIVEHTFTFRNTGTEPLVISNVGVSCGCTTPEYTKDPVLPGKTGKITARFNTSGKMGQQNKVLTVNSNNANGDVQLTLTGTIADPNSATVAAPLATPVPVAAEVAPVKKGTIKVKKDGQKAKVKMADGEAKAKK